MPPTPSFGPSGRRNESEEMFHGPRVAPGKQTLTASLPRQLRAAAGAVVQRVAEAMAAAPVAAATSATPAARAEDPFAVHMLSGDQGAAVLDQVEARAGGVPLEAGLRQSMESSFGADFSTVMVHQGEAAQAVGAEAYARGEALHFAPGRYNPGSASGRELIGHELAHVVQQREGRASTPQGSGLVCGDQGLEVEADAEGALAARGEPVVRRGSTAAPSERGSRQGRLMVRGGQAQIDQMMVFLSQWARINLVHDAQTGEMHDGGDLELPPPQPNDPPLPPFSNALRGLLRGIIGDDDHDAKLTVNAHMIDTFLGGFPIPDDLTGNDTSQRINWGQIAMVAAVAPDRAAAILAHEIAENYEAHQYEPREGESPMARSHEQGLMVESDVSQELGGGRRQGDTELDLGNGRKLSCFEYETEYLVLGTIEGLVGQGPHSNYDVRMVRRIPAVVVADVAIDPDNPMVGDQVPDQATMALQDIPQATAVTTSAPLRRELIDKGIAARRVKVRAPRMQQQPVVDRVSVRMPDHGQLGAMAQAMRNEH